MTKPLKVKNTLGDNFYLHSKVVHLRGGKPVDIYFMMKESQLENAESNGCTPHDRLPEGYAIRENPRNHYITVYRKSEGDSVNG